MAVSFKYENQRNKRDGLAHITKKCDTYGTKERSYNTSGYKINTKPECQRLRFSKRGTTDNVLRDIAISKISRR